MFLLFLTITAVGSSRNYGMRYLLPLAPLAIVWVSALAESRRAVWPRVAAASVSPGLWRPLREAIPTNSRTSTSWRAAPKEGATSSRTRISTGARGSKTLVRLQRERPEFRDITFYYFGDTDPAHYGVAGRCYVINAVDDQSHLPGLDRVETPYLAVSASLQLGPWGPPGFFRDLDRLEPVRLTDDTTIAIYRTADLRDDLAAHQ